MTDQPRFRLLRPGPADTTGDTAVRRGRNVIAVVGIDAYPHWPELRNAVGDGKGMRALFLERLGFTELVAPLFDAQATRDAILSLVQDQLAGLLAPDDSLVLFFAGHGHSERRRVGKMTVETGYLIPVEGRAELEGRFSSWVRLDSFLEDVARLPARHVLVILDACYSGFALGDSVHRMRSYTRYTDDLDRRTSRRVISSAQADQPALDNGPTAGHSLFTGTVIEGLDSGGADADGKGFVTGSELALYVQKQVAGWPGSRQTPDFGAFELDERGEMVIALRGETHNRLRAGECLEAATCIAELGRLTGDVARFASATRAYREALRYAGLAKLALPAAELGLGTALLAAGQADEGEQVLTALMESNAAPAEACLQFGIALARRGQHKPATDALDAWLAAVPKHPYRDWITDYATWLRRPDSRAGRRHVLLIGIDRYRLTDVFFPLQGCVNDVEKLMAPALVQHCGVSPRDVVTVVNEQATRAEVVGHLQRLARKARPEDAVLVHFSGHAVPSSRPDIFGVSGEDAYLILHDTTTEADSVKNGLSARELHRLVGAIPAGRTTLVLDTHGSSELVELAEREGTYGLILASDSAEIAYEWAVEIAGMRTPCGMLTAALYESLTAPAQPGPLTYQSWIGPAVAMAEQASARGFPQRQTPLFIGVGRLNVFGGDDPYLPVLDAVQGRGWPQSTSGHVTREYDSFIRTATAPFPQAHAAFGRVFLACGAPDQAAVALRTALDESPEPDPSILLGLARAYLAGGRAAETHHAVAGQTPAGSSEEQRRWADLATALQTATETRGRAVLVGIDDYDPAAAIPPLTGAVNDVTAVGGVLTRRWGFQDQDVVVLTDAAATREAVLDRFRWLVEHAGTTPALFHFSGYGSEDEHGLPTVVPWDGRQDGVPDISLEELIALAGPKARHLHAILDVGGGTVAGRVLAPVRGKVIPDDRFESHEAWARHVTGLRLGAFTVRDAPRTR